MNIRIALAISLPLLLVGYAPAPFASIGAGGQEAPATAKAASGLPATPEARRAAVETSLLPRRWSEGHAFEINERMRVLSVPGVSVAVIHNGRIDWAAGYGVRDIISGEPVTPETMFQAASISKPVSAMLSLKLAQEGLLDIDAPINGLLTSYQLPESDFGGEVTARRILSHTAGLGVHGFPGYGTYESLPSAAQVVAGAGNTDAVVRVEAAGESVRYSGGGSTLLQVALMDITGQDFASLAQKHVLGPLGMVHSTYAQPLDSESWPNHSAAHDWDGRQLRGRFHAYPEQFAAGLWTTPSDLARFAIELQRVAAGEDGKVLNAKWGQTMLTPELRNAALGLFIEEFDGASWFQHGGANAGFKCDFRASFTGGHGVVVMTNSELGNDLCDDIIRAVAKVYEWPDVIGKPIKPNPLSPEELQRYAGRYAFEPDEVVFVSTEAGRLVLQQLPYAPLPLAHIRRGRFQILGSSYTVTFHGESEAGADSLSMSMERDKHAARIAPEAYWPVQDLLLGNASTAITHYRDAFARDPMDPMVDSDRLIGLSNGLLQFQRPEAGLELAQTIAELYPDKALAWDALGWALAKNRQSESSAEAYRMCLATIAQDTSIDEGRRTWLRGNSKLMLLALE